VVRTPAIYSGFATTLATGLGPSRLELDMWRMLAGDKTVRVPPRYLLNACASLRRATTSQIWLRASQSWPFTPVNVASA
jgi:hypothetical protein